jgi:hypothetical protein
MYTLKVKCDILEEASFFIYHFLVLIFCMAKKEEHMGAGVVSAIAGTIAAGFYLYGTKGKDMRVKVRAWTLKAKAEVLEQFEKTQEMTEEVYNLTVDKVTARYGKLKTVGEEEAGKLNAELKKHWKAIKKAALEPAKGKKK